MASTIVLYLKNQNETVSEQQFPDILQRTYREIYKDYSTEYYFAEIAALTKDNMQKYCEELLTFLYEAVEEHRFSDQEHDFHFAVYFWAEETTFPSVLKWVDHMHKQQEIVEKSWQYLLFPIIRNAERDAVIQTLAGQNNDKGQTVTVLSILRPFNREESAFRAAVSASAVFCRAELDGLNQTIPAETVIDQNAYYYAVTEARYEPVDIERYKRQKEELSAALKNTAEDVVGEVERLNGWIRQDYERFSKDFDVGWHFQWEAFPVPKKINKTNGDTESLAFAFTETYCRQMPKAWLEKIERDGKNLLENDSIYRRALNWKKQLNGSEKTALLSDFSFFTFSEILSQLAVQNTGADLSVYDKQCLARECIGFIRKENNKPYCFLADLNRTLSRDRILERYRFQTYRRWYITLLNEIIADIQADSLKKYLQSEERSTDIILQHHSLYPDLQGFARQVITHLNDDRQPKHAITVTPKYRLFVSPDIWQDLNQYGTVFQNIPAQPEKDSSLPKGSSRVLRIDAFPKCEFSQTKGKGE